MWHLHSVLLAVLVVPGLYCAENLQLDGVKSHLLSEKHTGSTISHIFKETAAHLSARTDVVKTTRVSRDYLHEVIFVIHQRNMDELTRILEDVSDPKSLNYGKHMTKQEISHLTANPEAHEAVAEYLRANGASVTSKTIVGEYIGASAPIETWEKVFSTEFFLYHQNGGNTTLNKIVRAESYSIPRSLEAHVDSVFNTVQMPPRAFYRAPSPIVREEAMNYMTPALLRSFYNLGTSQGSAQSSQAVYASIGQFYSPKDLAQFQTTEGLPNNPVAYSIGDHASDSICSKQPFNCAEANLDVQYITSTSPVSPTTFWYTDAADFSTWLINVAAATNPPLVLSVSYGSEEVYTTASEMDAFNTAAIKLGALGITILVASGDDGAISNGARQYGQAGCFYSPDFPSSSPYVTSVGATSGPEAGTAEVVCQSDNLQVITSGGGFSNYFPAPSFQTAAISAYFVSVTNSNQMPYAGYGTGRGYPDISLAGANYYTLLGGRGYGLYGTSCATPSVAGFFSNINAARLADGKSSLGWVNPALYAYSSSFSNDITSGDNKCGAIGSNNKFTCCSQGYYAAPGWDPVSGLGSVNFGNLEKVLENLGAGLSMSPSSVPIKRTMRPVLRPDGMTFPSIFSRPVTTVNRMPTIIPTTAPSESNPGKQAVSQTGAANRLAGSATALLVSISLIAMAGMFAMQ